MGRSGGGGGGRSGGGFRGGRSSGGFSGGGRSGGSFSRVSSMEEAFTDAEIVLPINWAPYSFLEKRTELSAANLGTYIDLLEHELRENNKFLV